MRNLKINLILNILLSVSTVSMMLVNNVSLLVLDLTGNDKINLLLFLIVCFGQTIAFIYVIKYSLIPAIGLVRNTKELRKLEIIDKSRSTSIYKGSLTDCIISILNDTLANSLNGVSKVLVQLSASSVKSTSQILVDGSMVSLEFDTICTVLNISYVNDDHEESFSVVLNGSNKAKVLFDNSHRIDLKILEYVYQVICDLTRTDIYLEDFTEENLLVRCRVESEVFTDYKTYLTKNLVFKDSYEKV